MGIDLSTGCGDAHSGRYSEVIAAKTAAMELRPPTRVPRIEVFERPTVTDAGCRIPQFQDSLGNR